MLGLLLRIWTFIEILNVLKYLKEDKKEDTDQDEEKKMNMFYKTDDGKEIEYARKSNCIIRA